MLELFAAVSAGMIPASLGSDTAGSVRIPAALAGVSGFKPTFGRIALDGAIPLSATLDHAGVIARTLEDCEFLLPSLSAARQSANPWGVGPRSSITTSGQVSLKGVRIAVTDRTDVIDVDPDVRDGLQRSCDALTSLGATVVELPNPGDLSKAAYDTILLAEARTYHERYADRAELYRPSTREFLAPGAPPLPVDDYLRSQAERIRVTEKWQQWFIEHDVAALLEPTSAIPAPERGSGYRAGTPAGGTDPLTYFTATWNSNGFPVATLPTGVGSRSGLPVSVSLIGVPEADAHLLSLGMSLQEILRPPLLD